MCGSPRNVGRTVIKCYQKLFLHCGIIGDLLLLYTFIYLPCLHLFHIPWNIHKIMYCFCKRKKIILFMFWQMWLIVNWFCYFFLHRAMEAVLNKARINWNFQVPLLRFIKYCLPLVINLNVCLCVIIQTFISKFPDSKWNWS